VFDLELLGGLPQEHPPDQERNCRRTARHIHPTRTFRSNRKSAFIGCFGADSHTDLLPL
jgi:hypothetical protein